MTIPKTIIHRFFLLGFLSFFSLIFPRLLDWSSIGIRVQTLPFFAIASTHTQLPNDKEEHVKQARLISTQACNVSGLLSSNTTWSPSLCSEYIATGSVIVDTAITLTIDPGTIIKWNPGTTLTIRGALLAKGAAGQTILFTSNQSTPQPGDWGGIDFVDSSQDAVYDTNENYVSGSMIQHSIIEYAGKRASQTSASPAIDAKKASPYIDNTTIRNNQGTGVFIENGKTIHFTNNQILFNLGTGIVFNFCEGDSLGFVDTLIHKNTINDNKDGGVYIFPGQNCNPIITENMIANNSTDNTNNSGSFGRSGGLYCSGSGSNKLTTTLRKNIISNNSSKGNCGGVFLNWTDYHILEGNEINGNQSEQKGGGVCIGQFTRVLMSNNDIKNNVSKSGGGGVVMFGSNTVDTHIFHYNRFENNLDNGLPNHLYNEGSQSTPNVDAENNWWGSNDLATIESSIYHFADDSTRGVVDFEPFCNEACKPLVPPTATPTATPSNTPIPTPTPSIGNPIQQVAISGLTEGNTNALFTFTATSSPVTATLPITYIWQVNNQSRSSHTTLSLSDIFTTTWDTPGIYRLTVTAFNGIGTSSDTHTIHIKSPTGQLQSWLIMIYLNGDNSLDGETEELFNRLEEAVEVNPSLKIRVLWDRSKNGDTILYHVLPDNNPFTLSSSYQENVTKFSRGELDMGNREILLNFIVDTRKEFPNDYHLLSIVDHGGGWSPPLPDSQKSGARYEAGGSGFSWDDTTNSDDTDINIRSYLSTHDVGYVFNQTSITSDPIDLVFYDACLMAMLEEAYEIHRGAHLLLASQYLAWSSFPYDAYLKDIHLRSPEAQARHMVDQYHQSLTSPGLAHSLSAIDLSQTQAMIDALDVLAQKLIGRLSSDKQIMSTVFQQTQKLDMNADSLIQPDEGYIDLQDFAQRLVQAFPGTDVAIAAEHVVSVMSEFEKNKLIMYEKHESGRNRAFGYGETINLSGLHGISLYLPIGDLIKLDPDLNAYTADNIQLAADTRWDQFIFDFLGITPSQGTDNNFVGGRGNLIQPLSPNAKLFLPIIRNR